MFATIKNAVNNTAFKSVLSIADSVI